jgi:hypothetical protein
VAYFERPIFVGVRYCAREIGCHYAKVESVLGACDAVLRFGIRDQKAWIRERIDSILPKTETPITLYSRVEARRYIGISLRTSVRLLPDSVAVAFTPGSRGLLHPLFSESFLRDLRQSIGSGTIRVHSRGLRAPKFNAGCFPARHTISNIAVENERITRKRAELGFWSKI